MNDVKYKSICNEYGPGAASFAFLGAIVMCAFGPTFLTGISGIAGLYMAAGKAHTLGESLACKWNMNASGGSKLVQAMQAAAFGIPLSLGIALNIACGDISDICKKEKNPMPEILPATLEVQSDTPAYPHEHAGFVITAPPIPGGP